MTISYIKDAVESPAHGWSPSDKVMVTWSTCKESFVVPNVFNSLTTVSVSEPIFIIILDLCFVQFRYSDTFKFSCSYKPNEIQLSSYILRNSVTAVCKTSEDISKCFQKYKIDVRMHGVNAVLFQYFSVVNFAFLIS